MPGQVMRSGLFLPDVLQESARTGAIVSVSVSLSARFVPLLKVGKHKPLALHESIARHPLRAGNLAT